MTNSGKQSRLFLWLGAILILIGLSVGFHGVTEMFSDAHDTRLAVSKSVVAIAFVALGLGYLIPERS